MESRITGIYRINISWKKETRKHSFFPIEAYVNN